MANEIFDTAIKFTMLGAGLGAMVGTGISLVNRNQSRARGLLNLENRRHLNDYLDLRDILLNLSPLRVGDDALFQQLTRQLDGFCALDTIVHSSPNPKLSNIAKASRYRSNINNILENLGDKVEAATAEAHAADVSALLQTCDDMIYNLTMHTQNKLETQGI